MPACSNAWAICAVRRLAPPERSPIMSLPGPALGNLARLHKLSRHLRHCTDDMVLSHDLGEPFSAVHAILYRKHPGVGVDHWRNMAHGHAGVVCGVTPTAFAVTVKSPDKSVRKHSPRRLIS